MPERRWLAFYDARTEDQDERVEVWAKGISKALETVAFSVLVHDSDVLAMKLFASGKQLDSYDSNPAFSGRRPSKVTPVERAEKWASAMVPGHDTAALAAAFASKHVLAEAGLALLAPAIGAELGALSTGYSYLTSAGRVPETAVRVRARFAERPAWEKRRSGPPRLASQWERHEMEAPEVEPQRVLVGQGLHASAIAMNLGGAARGLRIAIDASTDCVELATVEAVITKTGRFQMDRYPAVLARIDGRYVAEIPDAALQPGFAGAAGDLVGAPMDAMLDAHHAGQIHINLVGVARHVGEATLAVELTPLANPEGAHVERLIVEVDSPRAVPLRAGTELHPQQLDRLANDSHAYLLVLLDAPTDRVKAHAIELLGSVRSLWPNGRWHAHAADERHTLDALRVKAGAAAWTTLDEAIRKTKARVFAASSLPRTPDDTDESCGFEVDVTQELGAVAIWLAKARVDPRAAEAALTAAVDAIARTGSLVQAVLARWQIDGGGIQTPYEEVVGIHGDFMATRGWATTWLRAIGRGQLWLGRALRSRLAAPLPAVVELGPALRIPVTDVAATEAALAALLPRDDDGHAYAREHVVGAADD